MRSNLDSSELSNHTLLNSGQPFPRITLLLILYFFFSFKSGITYFFSRVKSCHQLLTLSYSPISTELLCSGSQIKDPSEMVVDG